jgi:hypothetical protein
MTAHYFGSTVTVERGFLNSVRVFVQVCERGWGTKVVWENEFVFITSLHHAFFASRYLFRIAQDMSIQQGHLYCTQRDYVLDEVRGPWLTNSWSAKILM